tara:strand:- start:39063 stop:39326 length:264 start_codon:yes stop_codon:yes gene_type:complete
MCILKEGLIEEPCNKCKYIVKVRMTAAYTGDHSRIGYLRVARNYSPDVAPLKSIASVVNCTEALHGVRYLFNKEAINWYSIRRLVEL